jgi:hypothetical protein
MKDNNTRHNQIVKQMITMQDTTKDNNLQWSSKKLRKKIMKFRNEKNEVKLISSSYLLAMELVIPSTFYEPQ